PLCVVNYSPSLPSKCIPSQHAPSNARASWRPPVSNPSVPQQLACRSALAPLLPPQSGYLVEDVVKCHHTLLPPCTRHDVFWVAWYDSRNSVPLLCFVASGKELPCNSSSCVKWWGRIG